MSDEKEPFLTIKQAASLLGIKYWQLQRAIAREEIPYHKPFNSRKLVLLSEVLAALKKK